jgi:hypothetical protein
LKNFGDDNTIGTRFTLSFQTKNTVDNCDQGVFFDENKTFEKDNLLPTQDTQNPLSCKDEFIFKLPKIDYGDQG